MSSAAKEVMRKINRILQTRCIPDWVRSFMQKSFFERCPIHRYMPKNEQNRYCINCDKPLCKYCIKGGDHKGHMILTIYRHVYQDVIPLDEMEMTTLDCSKIQPYKCNKKWIVSMTPLPHMGSGALIEGDGACVVCKRKLTHKSFRFCSIKCMVHTIYGPNLIQAEPSGVGTSRQRDASDDDDDDEKPADVNQYSYRMRSRKGISIRAPLK